MPARLAALVLAGAAFVPSAPASASCIPQCLVETRACSVDVGYCAGSCLVNVGYCAPGGRCTVNVGYCDDNTKIPVGV